MLDQATIKSATPPQMHTTDRKRCFHCQEAVPKYTNICARIDGQERHFCCHGCEAVATFISTRDLGAFYQRRELDAEQSVPKSNNAAEPRDWSFLDDPQLAKPFIRITESGCREFTLSLQGVYCSSCSWLIKHALLQLSDQIDVHLDVSNRQLFLRLHDHSLSVAELLNVIHRLGYTPDVIALDELWQAPAAQHQQANRAALRRIIVAGFGMMQVMTYAVGLYFGDASGIDAGAQRFLSLVSLLVATVVVFYSGKPFFANAWQDLKRQQLGMDVPIALAIAGAYFPSVYQTLFNIPGHIFFDSAVMFIFFLSVGRYLEMRAQFRFSAAPVALNRVLPHFIRVQRIGSGEITITPREIELGDRCTLKQPQTVAFDGKIESGSAMLDEALITGESEPVYRSQGQRVIAGTRLIQGEIAIRAETRWRDSSLARIQQLLQRSQVGAVAESDGLQALTRHFVFALLLITTAVACVWWFIAPGQVFHIVLAMLVASCPCAFSLAAPIAHSAASFALRKQGLLLTNPRVLKVINSVSAWCMDKTGTLTRGTPKIQQVEVFGEQAAEHYVAIASAMERNQQHVLASAFNNSTIVHPATDVVATIGAGIRADVAGRTYFLGKEAWVIAQAAIESPPNLTDHNKNAAQVNTVAMLAEQGRCLARFYLRDELRPGLADTLKTMAASGQAVSILSGDKHETVNAQLAGLNLADKQGDLLPEQKQHYVRQLQDTGQVVAMVGDGVNDAAVIRQADLGIAMACGSELSHSQADIIMLNNKLSSLNQLKAIASQAECVTRQNMRWALIYNALALPLAASGLLTPWLAALGMSLSSLLVVLNAMRIARTKNSAGLTA